MRSLDRIVLHLDMDAFYAAIEVRDDPVLAGKPLIVGHRGRRGVVATCSYEARRFGVRSAMPSVTAERLCPDAIWLPGRMEHYVAVSHEIRRILDDFSPRVEPLSIDEAFLDLTGVVPDLAAACARAGRLKQRIRDEQKLTASIGVAPNKFLAKVASDLEKPDGLVLLTPELLPERFWPLPVRRLWGVGPRLAELLSRGGIRSIAELLRAGEKNLAPLVGKNAALHLCALARGEDDRPVESARAAKSISEERTYVEDLTDPQEIDRALLARAVGVARQLRREGLLARTVRIKVRTGDFHTITRERTLAFPTDLAEPLVAAARQLLSERVSLGNKGIRLLGLGVKGLAGSASRQGSLFDDPREARARNLAAAADTVRRRLGESSLTRARLLRKHPREGEDDSTGPEEAYTPPAVD